MLIGYKRGQGSIVLRVKVRNSSVSTGAGLTGLTFSSSGLVIGTIADNEATSTAYTQAGSTIETITTLGTYAAPTATKCRFKEVDPTNHKGVYEIQIADARYAVSNAKSLLVSLSGAANMAECDVVIPLRDLDPYNPGVQATRFGTCQAGSGDNTIVLDASASATNDLYKGCVVYLTGGTGAGQARLITAYVGSTKTATTSGLSWAVDPDATTTFVIIPVGPADVEAWVGASVPALVSGRLGVDLQTIKGQTVTCSQAVTVNANVGTTQPINFTGTAAAANVKADVTQIKTQTVTCSAGVTVGPFVGNATAALSVDATGGVNVTAFAGSGVQISSFGTPVVTVGSIRDGNSGNDIEPLINAAGYMQVDVEQVGSQLPLLAPIAAGACQSGSTSTTVKLASGESATTDIYKNCWIRIAAGTGAGQTRYCSAYNGSTKVATILIPWLTTPAVNDQYAIVPAADVEADLNTIKGKAVTCGASVTVGAFVGNANSAITVTSGQVNVGYFAGQGVQLDLTNGGVPIVSTLGIFNTAIGDYFALDNYALPAESATQPTKLTQAVRRLLERTGTNKIVRTLAAGIYTWVLRNSNDNANLEQKTQTTTGSVGATTDTQSKAT